MSGAATAFGCNCLPLTGCFRELGVSTMLCLAPCLAYGIAAHAYLLRAGAHHGLQEVIQAPRGDPAYARRTYV